ncbi:MAG: hypothetical protein KDH96_04930 [Candidatus Riesia sp.]|nr:hypothetical protein [Candidatus Riesia sp.]
MDALVELLNLIIKHRYDEIEFDEIINHMDSISVQDLMYMEEGIKQLSEIYITLQRVKQIWKTL